MTATLEDWERHRANCHACCKWRACPDGEAILDSYVHSTALRMAPYPEAGPVRERIAYLDLYEHRLACKKCKPLRLCADAVRQREEATAEIDEASARLIAAKPLRMAKA